MVVIGILVVVTSAIFVLANTMAGHIQSTHLREDPAFQQRATDRIRPVGQAAIAGRDNTGVRDPGGPRGDARGEGFQGGAGYMPPRGGHSNLTDQQMREAMQYMMDAIEG